MRARLLASVIAIVLLGPGCSSPDAAGDAGADTLDSGRRDAGDGATDAGDRATDSGATDARASDARTTGASDAEDAAGPSGTPSVTLTQACGEGPFPRDDLSPEPCDPNPAPACPQAPAPGAAPVMLVATCAYGRDERGCEPITGGSCPDLDGNFYDFYLINPNPGAPIGCWARAHLLVEPSAAGGGGRVEYGGYTLDHVGGCADLGMIEGEIEVPNACCEEILDLHFPHGEFTFRIAVRIDWTVP